VGFRNKLFAVGGLLEQAICRWLIFRSSSLLLEDYSSEHSKEIMVFHKEGSSFRIMIAAKHIYNYCSSSAFFLLKWLVIVEKIASQLNNLRTRFRLCLCKNISLAVLMFKGSAYGYRKPVKRRKWLILKARISSMYQYRRGFLYQKQSAFSFAASFQKWLIDFLSLFSCHAVFVFVIAN